VSTQHSSLHRLGSDPQKLFPRSAFDDQLKKFGRYGLFMAIITLPAVTADPDNLIDTEAISEHLNNSSGGDSSALELKSSSMYKERLKGIFEHMYELGYI
jgi:hypothetical protein